jgi:adenylylsulfate kinase
MTQAHAATQHVVWHAHKVTRDERAAQKNQKPCILWLTGLSGSGKSTIANALEGELFKTGHHSYLLDGDNVRLGLNKNLGFSDADRTENIRRIGEVSKLFVDAGLIVITAFISPFRADRDLVRQLVGPGEFFEIYCRAPLEVCEQRDPKGLYKKARAGAIKQFTGIDSPYEEPLKPELVIDTAQQSLEQSTQALLDALKRAGRLA